MHKTRVPLPLTDPGRTEFGFRRSACDCPDCTAYCRQMPGYLIPADLDRMRAQLGGGQELLAWARRHLLASPGAQVLRGGRPCRIPTLVPARRADGACRFLTADGRCGIHAVAPFGCAFFDAHQPAPEAERRSRRGLESVLHAWRTGGAYSRVWVELQRAGLLAPPPEDCRRRLRQAADGKSS